ncbi:MAG: HesA/MoeB/ThiF family protein [Bacillota bacterium]
MILEKDKINRYIRHILIPEISGAGQKKLLESSILICCESMNDTSALLYYAAASGIGSIDCFFEAAQGFPKLAAALKDLNPDLDFRLMDSLAHDVCKDYDAVIIIYDNDCYYKTIADILSRVTDTPVIAAVNNGCMGALKVMKKSNNSYVTPYSLINTCKAVNSANSPFAIVTKCLLGTLSVIEAIKLIVGIGKNCNGIYINSKTAYITDSREDFEKQCSIDSNNQGISKDIKNGSVLIVGSGGLGSPAAFALAHCGIGRIGLVDYDVVEVSNLNRQILHTTSRIGMPKVESAKHFLKDIKPDVIIDTYNERFSMENAVKLINKYDIVIDCLDNLPSRYLLNDACNFAKKPFIEAGVLAFNGLITKITPSSGPCYRCIFPEAISSSNVPSCSETGVLGPVPGAMGFLQAAEALKHVLGLGSTLTNKMLLFDAMDMEFNMITLDKDPACVLCSDKPITTELKNYEFFCSSKKSSRRKIN